MAVMNFVSTTTVDAVMQKSTLLSNVMTVIELWVMGATHPVSLKSVVMVYYKQVKTVRTVIVSMAMAAMKIVV